MVNETTPLRWDMHAAEIQRHKRIAKMVGLGALALVVVVVFGCAVMQDTDTVTTVTGGGDGVTCGTAANEAGYIKLPNKQDDHLFYWFFESRESYAGHYIPAAAHKIHLENKAAKTRRLNVQGIAIGNGLTNTVVQSEHGLNMVNNSYGVKLMDDETLVNAKIAASQCTALVTSCQTNTSVCIDAAQFCQFNVMGAYAAAGRNMMDIRQECVELDPIMCYGDMIQRITSYLNSAAVRSYLSVSDVHPTPWQSIAADVEVAFAADMMKTFEQDVAALLSDSSVRVLIYHGDADLVCNWYGGLAWTRALQWQHQDEFNAAEQRAFEVNARDAGAVWAYTDRLTFLRVFNAGHLAPMDQPEVALEMINRFLRSETL
ncbi:hypothetical protein PF007_g356 [Phytophthora fragariae]|uniref:Carboxypeptidase n=1 Tax=Phytophthora fragariae TaxID=53985 RepID=A0A6A3TSM2_9STRA|nr:hypothetical protein PF007_g356 [Phytophthora fragariae]